MSKIICDVCGTAYPEAATQCPICGCVCPADARNITIDDHTEAVSHTYQHVKGGRFSKTNVRKRNTGTPNISKDHDTNAAAVAKKKPAPKNSENTGLVITIFVLLLAILLVAGYIFVKFFMPGMQNNDDKQSGDNSGVQETMEDQKEILCLDVSLDTADLVLQEPGQKMSVKAAVTPADTTEKLLYTSDNEAVATVDANGIVTAVSTGNAVVTVTCGNASAQCSVTVLEPFVLETERVVFDAAGSTETIYLGDISANEIEWHSDDENVAIVEDGVVTAVGNGETKVYGAYNGITVSCSVSCNIAEPTDEDPEATDETNTGSFDGAFTAPYRLKNILGVSSSDVTLKVGESFILALLDANDKEVNGVSWTVQKGSSCTVDDGTVKAVASGYAEVVASYDGETFVCIVRVS